MGQFDGPPLFQGQPLHPGGIVGFGERSWRFGQPRTWQGIPLDGPVALYQPKAYPSLNDQLRWEREQNALRLAAYIEAENKRKAQKPRPAVWSGPINWELIRRPSSS